MHDPRASYSCPASIPCHRNRIIQCHIGIACTSTGLRHAIRAISDVSKESIPAAPGLVCGRLDKRTFPDRKKPFPERTTLTPYTSARKPITGRTKFRPVPGKKQQSGTLRAPHLVYLDDIDFPAHDELVHRSEQFEFRVINPQTKTDYQHSVRYVFPPPFLPARRHDDNQATPRRTSPLGPHGILTVGAAVDI